MGSLFDRYVKNKGYLAMGGNILDAAVVVAQHQRNTRKEDSAVKEGKLPREWENKPPKNRESDFSDKNRVNMDRRHKLVRRYAVTSGSVHDCQRGGGGQHLSQRAGRSEAGGRNRPLTGRQETTNTTGSLVQARA